MKVRDHWRKRFPDTLGLQGGFFLVMGGYTIKRSASPEKPEMLITLTENGFKKLLRKEANLQELAARFLENPFDKELIEDKGKADSISKTIVSFQALWMLLQCITRKANGLPITLAETHVAIQIVYAAFMYGCWWFKPLDVSVPISIPADDKLRQNESDYKQTDLYDKDMPIVIEYTEWNHYNMIYRMCHVVFSGFAYNQDHRQHRSELVGMALSALNGLLHGLAWNSHFPSPTEAVLWKLSCFGIALCPLATYFVSLRGPCIEAAVIAVWDIRFRGQFCGKDKAKTTSMVAAWRDYRHARYHSARMIEAKVTRGQFEVEESRRENGRPEWRWLLTVDIVWLMFLGYTMSIMYFAVEAFISIRSLPAGSYDLPSWANLLPHI
ncbi:hypothetical protein FN846DRAFT_787267 [Sphaerosporella brunnea]|uniref:Uncharacterized protein n=1 Tax=Sphaerosporella brunnea TaxID=1250544 RepID=A0A5J5EE30_9PEZI|nr:hypothetical protein FN846DRAFT_787267 [Sphaerosporella brunnea]